LALGGLLLIAVIGAFWWLKGPASTPVAQTPAYVVPNDAPLTPPRTPPQGFKEYRSEFYRFEVFYPEDLTVQTHPETRSGVTLLFKNADLSKGFQVYITPYGGADITERMIANDAPSGVVNNRSTTTLDGAQVLTFNGSDPSLGDTREVWFIKEGFLYEVTAPKALESWLVDILRSWIFLERGKTI